MSRIGFKKITIPDGVTVEIAGNEITVKGPKGELRERIHPDLVVEKSDGILSVKRPSDSRLHRSQHGLARTLINNMVVGVSQGYEKVLEVQGVGFRATLDGKDLVLNIGYSHPVRINAPQGIEFQVGSDERTRAPLIRVRGIDKQLVGRVAADIRRTRPPDPYKGKGVRYKGELIKLKQGKRATA